MLALDRDAGATLYRGGAPGASACYLVPTDTARAIARMLAAAGHQPDERNIGPHYELVTEGPSRHELWLDLVPMTPHGRIICNCG